MKASLFITCLADHLFPDLGDSVVNVLTRLGVDIDFPLGQTCCGQPSFNSGYKKETIEVAKHMISVFENSEYVVLPSGSCSGMIHHYYPYLFEGDAKWASKAENLISRTYEFSQFIVNVLKVEDVGAKLEKRATYHPSCHMSRILGVKDEPLRLLKKVKNLKLIDLPYANDCCGFGGTFSVKMGDISAAMVNEKARHVVSTEADVLIGSDMGCLMNIGGCLNHQVKDIPIMHLAQVLDQGV